MRRHQSLTLALMLASACSAANAATEPPENLLIEQGLYWQTQENPGRATEVWQKLLLIDATQPDALYGLGLLAVQKKDLPLAQSYLEKLQASAPNSRQALLLAQDILLQDPAKEAQLNEARVLVESEEPVKAAEAYIQLLEGRPAQGLIGREYYNSLGFVDKYWPESRSGFERLMREYPKEPYTKLFFAQHLVRRADTRPEGIGLLAQLAKRQDIGGAADETWRMALTWMGPPNKSAQPLFEQFLSVHPDDDEIRGLLAKGRTLNSATAGWKRDPVLDKGFKALERKNLAEAEQIFSTYLKAHPKDADALGGLGLVRQRQDRLEDADVLITSAISNGGRTWQNALNDVRYWAVLKQARAQIDNDKASDALVLLERARQLRPDDSEAIITQADVQAQRGQLAAAEAGYRQVLAMQQQQARALRGLVMVLSGQGRVDEALRLLAGMSESEQKKVGGVARLRAEAALQRAKQAEQRGDLGALRAELEAALREDPNNAWANFSLARVYADRGDVAAARRQMDELLKRAPNDVDALHTSALLAAQLEDFARARELLARIPANQRSAEIQSLESDLSFNIELQSIRKVINQGQRREARAFLRRLEDKTGGDVQRTTALALAAVDADDPEYAVGLMRNLLARSSRTDVTLMLSYAGVMLRAQQDVEVAGILRDLQSRPMTPAQRKQFADLSFTYRVRQAEELRQRGELERAYATLEPALAERPQDPLALSALARMYAENGDSGKALEIFKPLVERFPNDANLLVGAADMASQQFQTAYANDALERALALAPHDRTILAMAAKVYNFMGRSGTAEQLLSKVVAQENRDKTALPEPRAAAMAQTRAAPNPFTGVGLSAKTLPQHAAIPEPSENLAVAPKPKKVPGEILLPTFHSSDDNSLFSRTQSLAKQDTTQKPSNPFALAQADDTADTPAARSDAARALDSIVQARSPYVVQGVTARTSDGESGMGQMTDVQAPFEASMALGDNRVALRVTPVSLRAGSVSASAANRFGDGPLAPSVAAGSQDASGVGVAVAFDSPAYGMKSDIGITPSGFLYSTPVGGISVNRRFAGQPDLNWGVAVSRRAVTDSVLSFAGAEDERSGLKWGGVTANGGRAQLAYDDNKVGAYVSGSWHRLLGHDVQDNDRMELSTGAYWYWQNDEFSQSTVGLSFTGIRYSDNLGFYTYGHGGYFSPQSFLALGVPVTWAERFDRFTFQLKGSVGIQSIQQDGADFFPGDSARQAAASAALGRPAVYASDNTTAIGYSLSGAAEYRLDRNWFLGGHVGVDNGQNYQQWNGGLYLRYMFEEQTGAMALPVSPYTSPYSN
ncbi:Cellulose synthase operon protein C [Pseudomonas sp. 8Z]|uniref:cellulose biosynthesis protein BcsC n=1 Tax=Pseudomonas sp. 8Z TaxID=2653166 RepID=UPI0012F1E2B2|nr:cellulose biosynthesis protein BcsC [Pseudomonas sp. 8Z]VXC43842.1 Cellulose synthase operon protein C [Pseudomonas sp. 8Z]